MSLNLPATPTCYQTCSRGEARYVRFLCSHRRHGFAVGQLPDYTLEANSADGDGSPPERLTIRFPTADVVVLGARLGKIVEAIDEQSLIAIIPLDARYEQTLGRSPWVAEITVTRIDKNNVGGH